MSLVIHNLRAGFATNSSSSHSVVILPPHLVGTVQDTAAPEDGGYGSNDFILASTEEKMRYLAAQLVGSLRTQDRKRFIRMFEPYVPNLREIMPKSRNDWSGMYVDHQSAMTFPASGVPMDFASVLMRTFLSENVVIYGGGDGGSAYAPSSGTKDEPIYAALKDNGYRSITRIEGGYLTVYDKFSGNKMRLSADDLPPYVKAQAPELVDLKITDFCTAGCAFCYQSSTKAGVHAPIERILATVETLKAMGVFEVAIGGGEPTEHPDFIQIVNAIEGAGMTANFTTFSDRWLENAALVDVVHRHVRAIGVSVTNAKGLALAEAIRTKVRTRWHGPQIMVQHVVGSVPLWVTTELMTAAFEAKFPVLLLGYKEVGFGGSYTRHDIGEDVPFMIKMAVPPGGSLSVDTALLDQHPSLPAMIGAPLALTTSPEGKFSCYVDAVTDRMAPSSYVQPDVMEPMQYDPDAFKAAFAAY